MIHFKLTETSTPARAPSKRGVITAACTGAVAIILIIIYIVGAVHYSSVFLPNTVINGCDVSSMNASETAQRLARAADEYTLTLVTREGSEVICGSDIGLSASVSTDEIENMIDKQNSYAWPLYAFSQKSYTADTATVEYLYDDEMLTAVLNSLNCVSPENPTQASDAQLVLSGGEFIILPEVYGNTADKEVLESAVRIAVESQSVTLNLSEAGVYDEPAVLADDEKLTAQKDLLNSIADVTITLTFGESTESADISKVMTWLYVSETYDGYSLAANTDALSEYAVALSEKYDTAGEPIDFETTDGETITLTGDYGWKLDTEYAAQTLGTLAAEGTSVSYNLTDHSAESEMWWEYTAVSYGTVGSEYYGDSYAEVCVSSQHMWLYSGGEVAMESDVVTGNPSVGHDTPTGAFRVRALRTDTTLNGEDYSVDVAYFIVFADDVGFHDAVWQPYFGGDWYCTNGSHGCVNMPLDAIEEMYGLVRMGMPVFVY